MIVVLDTNLVVSAAIIPTSVAKQCFDHAIRNHEPLCSLVALDELLGVLHRSRFDKYVSIEDRIAFFTDYARVVSLVFPTCRLAACRDDDDNRVLEIALDGQANVLVTGDQDLLVLAGQFPFVICTPREYLDRFATA